MLCYANTVQNTGNTISTIKDGGVSIMAKTEIIPRGCFIYNYCAHRNDVYVIPIISLSHDTTIPGSHLISQNQRLEINDIKIQIMHSVHV